MYLNMQIFMCQPNPLNYFKKKYIPFVKFESENLLKTLLERTLCLERTPAEFRCACSSISNFGPTRKSRILRRSVPSVPGRIQPLLPLAVEGDRGRRNISRMHTWK